MRRHHPLSPALLAGTMAIALLATANPTPPHAAPSSPDPASAYLREHPGGTKLNDFELRYGPIIVTVARTAAQAALADCPAGWYCFYSGRNYTGTRGRLSSCGWQDLARYGWDNRIESAYYDLFNGQVTFYDRVNAADPNDDRALFTVSAATRGDPDTSPYRDKADYVYRRC